MNYAQGNHDRNARRSEEATSRIGSELREKAARARDLVEDVRGRAEVVFRERPYLVPVAAGAVGLGVGILLGSKITRFLVFTAVGTVISETFGGEIRRFSRALVQDVSRHLEEPRREHEHEHEHEHGIPAGEYEEDVDSGRG